jgi:hypothetical protein
MLLFKTIFAFIGSFPLNLFIFVFEEEIIVDMYFVNDFLASVFFTDSQASAN